MSELFDLLRIDADAAARKLSEKRYRSPTESIVALIRLVASFEPDSVFVTIARGFVEIVSKGGLVDAAVFRYAAALFDAKAPKDVRIEALRRLEGRPGAAFLAAFSEKYTKIVAAWQERPGRGRYLEFTPRRSPRGGPFESSSSFRLSIVGRLGSPDRAAAAARSCRFSFVPITVNGQRVNRGPVLSGCLYQRRYESEGLKGTFGIPREGALSSLIRLEHGIVVEETFYGERRGLIFDVLAENGDELDGKEILDRLREGGSLLYRELAARYGALRPKDREAAKERLTSRYEHSFDRALVSGLAFFERADGGFVDLFEIKKRAARERVFGLDRDTALDNYRTRNRFVLRLDAAERRFLHQSIGLAAVEPPLRVSPRGLRFFAEHLLEKWRRRCRHKSHVVAPVELGEMERRFRDILTSCLPQENEIRFTSGRRLAPVEQNNKGRIIYVPLGNKAVRRMMKATVLAPDLAFPAVLFLTEGTVSRDQG